MHEICGFFVIVRDNETIEYKFNKEKQSNINISQSEPFRRNSLVLVI